MEKFDLYRDIAERTDGDIYIGVVGPVRTGKSTLIKSFMELLVLPNIDNDFKRERAKDEMPQSGSGRTIMTTQPKFVPNEAVEISLKENASLKIRLVDCVGYMVKGAMGHMEDDHPRMVRTPWYDYDIPFEEAAELGTRKVIAEHSTIGLVVTTDGSITDIPRSNYVEAEERVVRELKELNKPFVIILNSRQPNSQDTVNMRDALEEKYDVPVLALDVLHLELKDINEILSNILFEFPLTEIRIDIPKWVQTLDEDHWLIGHILDSITASMDNLYRVRDVEGLSLAFEESEFIDRPSIDNISLGTGEVEIGVNTKSGMFYKVLGEECGYTIEGDYQLIGLMKELSAAKKEYDRVADALRDVRETGYGMVPPSMDELALEEPEIVKQGNRFGVRLKASAPSLHFIRADIETEVSPIVGTEKESEELIRYILEEFETDPSKIWDSNIFGKSLHELVKEGLSNKLMRMPDDAQMKIQETLQRIINDGSGGLICIIL
ncbi:stage IV sporulation protein A [Xylanivirga thermophila]|uniref:stage IV sporulation protein A n=1 Tax=Xylanivirga thermophila TaxID=2496273 RepID=UPI00101BA261|nr:stage IV sporulation protein A [Xylanivirga thermophila]